MILTSIFQLLRGIEDVIITWNAGPKFDGLVWFSGPLTHSVGWRIDNFRYRNGFQHTLATEDKALNDVQQKSIMTRDA